MRDRIAEGSCPRGATRVARVCEMRQQTTDARGLSVVRLNFCRHRRHLDEQRERARRRPAVAGRAEPGLNRPRRRSRPGRPTGGRPADTLVGASPNVCEEEPYTQYVCSPGGHPARARAERVQTELSGFARHFQNVQLPRMALQANLEMCTLDGCAPCFTAIRAIRMAAITGS